MVAKDVEPDEFVIVTHNVTAMRLVGDRASEQVSQQICGQVCLKLDTGHGWTKVESADGYHGWIVDEHLCTWPYNSAPWSPRAEGGRAMVVTIPLSPFYHTQDRESAILLPMGCIVHKLGTEEPLSGSICAVEAPLAMTQTGKPVRGFMRQRDLEDLASDGAPWTYDPVHVCHVACTLQGVPYLWGGTTPFGYDCSGFVQAIYALHGVNLPRDAYQQAAYSAGNQLPADTVPSVADLIFFRGSRNPHRRKVSHVGIAMGNGRVVHASGLNGVAISELASQEIAGEYEITSLLRLQPPA